MDAPTTGVPGHLSHTHTSTYDYSEDKMWKQDLRNKKKQEKGKHNGKNEKGPEGRLWSPSKPPSQLTIQSPQIIHSKPDKPPLTNPFLGTQKYNPPNDSDTIHQYTGNNFLSLDPFDYWNQPDSIKVTNTKDYQDGPKLVSDFESIHLPPPTISSICAPSLSYFGEQKEDTFLQQFSTKVIETKNKEPVLNDYVSYGQALDLEEVKTESLTICELCEVSHVRWKCLTCNDHICEICKRAHMKSKLSSNHKVVEMTETASDPIMIHKEQETTICTVHSEEKIQMFCTVCKMFVCHDCIVDGLHRNHTFLKIDHVLRSKQAELTSIISELETKLTSIVDDGESLKKNEKKYIDENDRILATVRNHNEQLKNEIDKISQGITSKIQQQVRLDKGIFKQRNEQITQRKTELTNLMEQCKEQQNSTNLNLVSFVAKVRQSCKKYDANHLDFCHLSPPKFTIHPINSSDLTKLFGDLECDPEKGSDYELN